MTDRGGPGDYYWFCMEHIRQYNKSWNFFAGMSDDEVLRYKDEDITGHRPTWAMGTRMTRDRKEYVYDDPFDFRQETGIHNENDSREHRDRMNAAARVDPLTRKSLATLKQIKKRHKELAKKYHPDIRGGDKQAEEILKNINQAYTHLLSCGNS
jgi:hypothetical protein